MLGGDAGSGGVGVPGVGEAGAEQGVLGSDAFTGGRRFSGGRKNTAAIFLRSRFFLPWVKRDAETGHRNGAQNRAAETGRRNGPQAGGFRMPVTGRIGHGG